MVHTSIEFFYHLFSPYSYSKNKTHRKIVRMLKLRSFSYQFTDDYPKGVPFGSGYPLYLFCLFRTKKDAAAIPNATTKAHLKRQLNKINSNDFQETKTGKMSSSQLNYSLNLWQITFSKKLIEFGPSIKIRSKIERFLIKPCLLSNS